MNGKRCLLYLCFTVTLFIFTSCGIKSVEPESSVASSKAESGAESSTTTHENDKRNPELTQAITEIAMDPKNMNVSCDVTEFSGGSFALTADKELFLGISNIFSKYSFEELDLANQPPYSRFIKVASAYSKDDWSLTFLEESETGGETPEKSATYLSLMKDGYLEPVFFTLDRTAFDELYKMANDRVYFVEPPVEEFVEPLQRLLEEYRNGTVKNNELEPRFDPFPEGEEIPDVQSADDFKVVSGNEMASYYVVIPIGAREEYRMVVGMVYMYPAYDQPQEPYWTATSASVMTIDRYLQFTLDERYKNRYTKYETASE